MHNDFSKIRIIAAVGVVKTAQVELYGREAIALARMFSLTWPA